MKTKLILVLLSAFSHQLSASPRPAINHQPSTLHSAQAVRAILGEAAGEGETGMLAVAAAIRNRGTLKGVYGLRNPAVDRAPARVWASARRAWAMSATNDITLGATHWENVKAFGKPRWASSLTVTTNIGRHTFYK